MSEKLVIRHLTRVKVQKIQCLNSPKCKKKKEYHRKVILSTSVVKLTLVLNKYNHYQTIYLST